ncbi:MULTISPECIES: N-acetylmuramoyl-L-alanine amidase [unclassified Rhodococcus (in: high G+C Gram-positive bacteria)]|jgi:N-acetylmuramoyl-L-alanine amidase|uniref:N-acetylmuramoyl-L-alanine amidase n=1 Tax=unclassified Rhodococcus (in: high G+C Gram-positive bacteria) TaxID=192944 RepID=UPI000488A6CD|nr:MULTISPECIES: N-acetylmuramoyl-L-alanine amidase [unclassified Rhodococcus (in: high G+C Gram-positive bacteria)]KQU35881.1 N-acetylmuramoyl-L-alanine amidase [Rhodococcus sp. Leaf225]KQU48428.1 N-acetylmuramoyl-L-alanine amidase [Rhodococcus sp. Leaf258]MBY6677375.1 peptidoglycan-binding protein [Rhodococcus sp. BP-332]MBY6680110.1 peptidoglycan-binding protein [Rhodococcus sp. BP-316]MBY6687929.1 peptidoglycan-binding protein [Rhodococcus sp. BP-288]
MKPLRHGDRGPAVAEVRDILSGLGFLPPSAAVDGDTAWAEPDVLFDAALDEAVRAFQQQRGLLVTGEVDTATYRSVKEASFRLGARTLIYQLSAPLYGDDVATLQRRLQDLGFYNGRVDGYFGGETHEGLSSFQSEIGLSPDGICGPATLRALDLLGTRVTGGSPHAISEEELVRRSGPQLTGKRIVIDPGLGGVNSGMVVQTPDGPLTEEAILWDLAGRLEGRMAATGMETYLSRARSADPSTAERAETANGIGADLMISLRCSSYPSPVAHGVASFHFGNSHGSASLIGQVLTSYIQREIVARTSLQDCRSHGRTWDLLRLTNMPTVQLELGYLTSHEDVEVLADPRMRDIIAEAVLVAVKRLYLLGQDDQPTGTFTFAELLAYELSVAEGA